MKTTIYVLLLLCVCGCAASDYQDRLDKVKAYSAPPGATDIQLIDGGGLQWVSFEWRGKYYLHTWNGGPLMVEITKAQHYTQVKK